MHYVKHIPSSFLAVSDICENQRLVIKCNVYWVLDVYLFKAKHRIWRLTPQSSQVGSMHTPFVVLKRKEKCHALIGCGRLSISSLLTKSSKSRFLLRLFSSSSDEVTIASPSSFGTVQPIMDNNNFMTLYGKIACLQPGATMKKIIIANYYSISAHLIINHKLTKLIVSSISRHSH